MSRTSFHDRPVSNKPLVDTSTLCGAVATSDLQVRVDLVTMTFDKHQDTYNILVG